ncbi:MAG: hypothetical protein GTO41_18240 [Burkholderiales bacterium]|nr:hypothetical protein [Burkholderiales bacterium]
MNESAIDHIWQQIQALGEEEQLRLQERMASVAEEQWRTEASTARRIARDKGIDQAAIDRAVDKVRYGR